METAARDGLPPHVLEQSLWHICWHLGYGLQAACICLGGGMATAARRCNWPTGGVVKRLPESRSRPYHRSHLRGVYSGASGLRHTWGGPSDSRPRRWMPGWDCRRIVGLSAAALELGLGGGASLRPGSTPYLGRILGLKRSVASLETMPRTLAGRVPPTGHPAADGC